MFIIINSGSSSLKFKVFDNIEGKTTIAEGLAERIGVDGKVVIKYQDQSHSTQIEMKNHEMAVKIILDQLLDLKIIKSYDEIKAIGSRVVHGGEEIKESVAIDEKVKDIIKKSVKLAPLHNPGALVAIQAFENIVPKVLQVASFDTSFHQTLAAEQYLYPVPNNWYEQHQVRKYGFHGISYQYICKYFGEINQKKPQDLNLVICHLGNGSSVCCVKDGKSFDTTMGFTPLDGLMMGTRSGSVDPSIIEYMIKETKQDASKITEMLNKQSGLLGVSEVSSDMRDITIAAEKGDKKAKIALEMYTQRVAQWIVQYLNNLDSKKIDGIIFTAGIGENSHVVRAKIIEKIKLIPLEIDDEKNKAPYSDFKKISKKGSSIDIFAFRTDEEKMILNDIKKFIKN